MIERFGIVKGAKKWRVVEFVGNGVSGIPEYRYATDPLSTKTAAVGAYKRLTLSRDTKLVNPLDEDF